MRKHVFVVLMGGALLALASPVRAQMSLPLAIEISRGDVPSSGLCRVWTPGEPSSSQPRARTCSGIEFDAPRGSYVLYRPRGKRVVHVCRMSSGLVGVVDGIDAYDLDRFEPLEVVLRNERRTEETTVKCTWEKEEGGGGS
jgi:hypothetical protein